MPNQGKPIPDLPRLDGFFTMSETAELLQVTHGRIWQMYDAGKFGQAYRIGPHIILQKAAVMREFEFRLTQPRYAGLLKNRDKILGQPTQEPKEFDLTLDDAVQVLMGQP